LQNSIVYGDVALEYSRRVVDDELDELLDELPAISLEGPRGVGKTATAERRARTKYYLDTPAQRAIAEADPNQILSGEHPVLIDEWQKVPAVWDAVRRAVDRGSKPGSFLLTGSASPSTVPTHSGAGRIVTLRMRPMSLCERLTEKPSVSIYGLLSGKTKQISGSTDISLADYIDEIVRTGFPGIRNLSFRGGRMQIDSYLQRIIDTDFREQSFIVRRPEVLRRWIAAYAAATATTASFETIRDSATGGHGEKPSRTTTQPYRDILERVWILDSLPAWLPTRNYLKKMGQSPKHHLADPGLTTRVLGLGKESLLSGEEPGAPLPKNGTLLGNLFESLATLCVRVYAQPAEARLSHLRLHNQQREVDLIVERRDQGILAIEVKLSGTVEDEDVRNLLWLRDRLGSGLIDAVVLNAGPWAYRRKDGIAVVPLALLGP